MPHAHGGQLSHTPFAHPARNASAFGLREGMHVADFGSGSGAYVLAMAPLVGEAGQVYAVDVQRDLLRRTHTEAQHRGLKQVSVLWADLEQRGATKLAARSLDLVLVSNLLFQLEEKDVPLAEAWRVLKPTGRLVVIDWSDSFNGMGPIKQQVVSKDTALGLVRASGFELDRELDAGAHHYGLVCKVAPKAAV